MKTSFWGSDPYILLNKSHLTELWPDKNMEYNQKLNAISRSVIILTLIGLLTDNRLKVLVTGTITLGIIYIIHLNVYKKREAFENMQEAQALDKLKHDIIEDSKTTKPSVNNPLMNVMLNEYKDNPQRPEAQKAYLEEVELDINNKAKAQIKELNYQNKDIDKKIFKNLGDNLEFDNSMRNYYATANTTIPSAQRDFAEFCYGDTGYDKEFYKTLDHVNNELNNQQVETQINLN